MHPVSGVSRQTSSLILCCGLFVGKNLKHFFPTVILLNCLSIGRVSWVIIKTMCNSSEAPHTIFAHFEVYAYLAFSNNTRMLQRPK